MVSKKHGRVKKYTHLFNDTPTPTKTNACIIQKAEYEDGSKTIGVRVGIHENNKKWGFTFYFPSYKGMRVLIDGLVEIYGVAEVERELNIKIMEVKDK